MRFLILSNRIREYRRKLGWTQEHLAKVIGVSKNTISAYELGVFEPRLEHVYNLCVVFQCDFFDLFYYE